MILLIMLCAYILCAYAIGWIVYLVDQKPCRCCGALPDKIGMWFVALVATLWPIAVASFTWWALRRWLNLK